MHMDKVAVSAHPGEGMRSWQGQAHRLSGERTRKQTYQYSLGGGGEHVGTEVGRQKSTGD